MALEFASLPAESTASALSAVGSRKGAGATSKDSRLRPLFARHLIRHLEHVHLVPPLSLFLVEIGEVRLRELFAMHLSEPGPLQLALPRSVLGAHREQPQWTP